MEWDKPQSINRITLFDRASLTSHTAGVTLHFEDGSQVYVNSILNDGTARTVDFPTKVTRWVKVEVTDGDGLNLGFSEIEVFPSPEQFSDYVLRPGSQVMGQQYWTKITEGKAIGTLYGYKTNGIVQLGEDPSKIPFFRGKTLAVGDRKYLNKNSDNELNEEDLFELGNANPDFTYGWNNTSEYQLKDKSRLRFTLFLQGVYGNEIVNFNKFALESFKRRELSSSPQFYKRL